MPDPGTVSIRNRFGTETMVCARCGDPIDTPWDPVCACVANCTCDAVAIDDCVCLDEDAYPLAEIESEDDLAERGAGAARVAPEASA